MNRVVLGVLVLFGAGCGPSTRACKAGTVFVDVTVNALYNVLSAFDAVTVDITADGATTSSVLTLPPNVGDSAGFEIDFPGGYDAGKTITIALSAMPFVDCKVSPADPGCPYSASATVTLAPVCTRVELALAGDSFDMTRPIEDLAVVDLSEPQDVDLGLDDD